MKEAIREFFGYGEPGFTREPEGWFSWQHLTLVTSFMIIMTVLAVYFGRKNKNADERAKNRVLVWAAILIDSFELFKIVLHCVDNADPMGWVDQLPLFLCSIQLITIPLAAFSGGRVREASIDFVLIFGLLGAVLGTYFAGQNYTEYPVFSCPNVISGITHSISGFAALYIGIAGMSSMKKSNAPITVAIVCAFSVMAYIANVLGGYNYMFLMRGDGTPYDIFYNLVGGNRVIYPLLVVLMLVGYIFVFDLVFNSVRKKLSAKASASTEEEKETATV